MRLRHIASNQCSVFICFFPVHFLAVSNAQRLHRRERSDPVDHRARLGLSVEDLAVVKPSLR